VPLYTNAKQLLQLSDGDSMMSSRMKSGPSQFDVHLRTRLSEMDNTITGVGK